MTDYTLDYADIPIGELPDTDIEKLLAAEQTDLKMTHGEETILDPDAESLYVSRPRVVRSLTDRSGPVATISFTAEVTIPVDSV